MDETKEKITDLQDKFKAAIEHETWRKFIENAVTDFEFKEGIQWSNEEISTLSKRGQPTTVENEIKPIIDRIIGQYKQMKTKIIYRGRNVGMDEEHNNLYSAIALHIQQQSNYEFEEGDMFDDGQTCGFGCMEVFVDFEKDLSPKVVLKHENALNIFPDPNSKRYDWNEDAEYICRAKWVSFNEAKQLYPEYKEEIEGFINSNPVVNTSQRMERNNLIDYRLKRIRLVEVWYKTWEKKKFAFHNALGGVLSLDNLSKEKINEIKKTLPDVRFHERIEAKIKVGIFVGDTLLEDKDSPYKHGLFPFAPYFVYRRKNGEPYSMVRMLKDPQMEINKRRSKALHLLNTNQAVFEEGAARDEDELRSELAKPDGLIKYKKGFTFEIHKNIDLAASQISLQAESKTAMARISGVSDEAMARHSEVRSGIGIQRKQAMTDIIIAPIFDNLRRTRKMIGELILELVKQYYTEEKMFSIVDDLNQVQHFSMDRESIARLQDYSYDTVIEEAPNTSTIQEEQFAYLAELVKGLGLPPNIGVALLPIFIRLSTLKNKDEVAKILEQLQQLPPERPKMSLSLVWSELYPVEKAKFAEMMGFSDLAQFEMQMQTPPKYMADAVKENPELELQKQQMQMQVDLQKHQMSMGMKQDMHQQNMIHKEDEYLLNLERKKRENVQRNNTQSQ